MSENGIYCNSVQFTEIAGRPGMAGMHKTVACVRSTALLTTSETVLSWWGISGSEVW